MRVTTLTVLLFLLIAGCEGPMGPEGPEGPVGPEGSQGAQGPAGENATALAQIYDLSISDLDTVRYDTLEADTITFRSDERVWRGTVEAEFRFVQENDIMAPETANSGMVLYYVQEDTADGAWQYLQEMLLRYNRSDTYDGEEGWAQYSQSGRLEPSFRIIPDSTEVRFEYHSRWWEEEHFFPTVDTGPVALDSLWTPPLRIRVVAVPNATSAAKDVDVRRYEDVARRYNLPLD